MPTDDAVSIEPVLSAETVERVRRIPLFSSLDPGRIPVLLGGAEVQASARDTVLFAQGDEADCFYIVLAGRVALSVVDNAGRESVIEVVKPGDTFGEGAIFDHGLFPFGARVIEEARLVRVPSGPFLLNLAKDFSFVTLMLASMSAHLRFLVAQVGELKLKTTEQRLGSYLLAQVQGSVGAAKVHLPYDKKILASQLGMTPESLSRALAKLRDVGVSSEGGVISMADIACLRDFCRESDFLE